MTNGFTELLYPDVERQLSGEASSNNENNIKNRGKSKSTTRHNAKAQEVERTQIINLIFNNPELYKKELIENITSHTEFKQDVINELITKVTCKKDLIDAIISDPEFKSELINTLISEDTYDLMDTLTSNNDFKQETVNFMTSDPGFEREVINTLVKTNKEVRTAYQLLIKSRKSGKSHDAALNANSSENLQDNTENKNKNEEFTGTLNRESPDEKHAGLRDDKYALSDLFSIINTIGEKTGQSYGMLAEERRNSNRILLNINAAIDGLASRVKQMENVAAEMKSKADVIIGTPRHVSNDELLARRDIEILNIVDELGKACADDIRERFGYKNRNAASARLSRLEERGLLNKKYVGRQVYYTSKSPVKSPQPDPA